MKEMRDFAVKRAQEMREKALAVAKSRKEEFIGARVPRELRDKVTARANAEGVSVSILVRRILEQAFSEKSSISTTINEQSASDAKFEEQQRRKQKFANVLAWESISLNTQVNCACCNRKLNEGERVTVGLTMTGGSPVVLCNPCKEAF